MAEFSPKKRGLILHLSKEGQSTRNIANNLNVSQSGVAKTLKKYKNQADGKLESSSRSGRPRILKQAGMRLIKQQVLQNPRITPYELITNIGMEGKIAKRTVRHALCKELKLKSYKPAKKPFVFLVNT